MTVSTTFLTRAAGAAAVAAGVIFIGVNIDHPHLDATSIATTEVIVRNCLKVLMAVLALVGITGMYLSRPGRNGLVGLVGYLLLAPGYLLIMSTAFLAAFVLPTVSGTDPSYVADVIAATTGGAPTGDIGALGAVLKAQDLAYLVGGLVFGVGLYRARVLARWASALLAVGGVVTVVLSLLPDALYRLLAFPNGIAMIGLGCSLWISARADVTGQPATVRSSAATTVMS